MTAMEPKTAPIPSIRRLPQYLSVLRRMQTEDREYVSCTHIAEELRLDPTQVRKDLAVTGIVGRPKVGYPLIDLVKAVEEFLGWKNATDAFLIGAGHLGTALMGFEGFSKLGLNIVAAFDVDPSKQGMRIRGKEVFELERLPDLAQRLHVHLGVLTVPARAAQEATDIMVSAGIRGIWNFASTRLEAPEDVIVENVDLASSLAVLSSRLEAALKG